MPKATLEQQSFAIEEVIKWKCCIALQKISDNITITATILGNLICTFLGWQIINNLFVNKPFLSKVIIISTCIVILNTLITYPEIKKSLKRNKLFKKALYHAQQICADAPETETHIAELEKCNIQFQIITKK